MARVVISVYRGVVSDVYSDDDTIEVEVIDCDEMEFNGNTKEDIDEAKKKVEGLIQIL